MGISYSVSGIKPPDEKWRAFKNVLDVCKKYKIDPPSGVYDFFEGEAPDPAGVVVKVPHDVVEDRDRGNVHWIVDVADIPKDVTQIRFTASY